MDALDVVLVCVRRWWVMLPVLLLTAAAGAGLVREQKPVFHAAGGYALVYTHGESIPVNGPDPRNANPLADRGGALIGEALIADFMSAPTQRAIGAVGNSGSAPDQPESESFFSVALPPQGASTYTVQTWGPNQQDSQAVVARVLAAAPAKAARIQDRAGAPKYSQYTTFVTSPAQVEMLPPPSSMKLLIAVGAVGLMAGAALSVIVDRLIQRRSLRVKRARRSVLALVRRPTRSGSRRAQGPAADETQVNSIPVADTAASGLTWGPGGEPAEELAKEPIPAARPPKSDVIDAERHSEAALRLNGADLGRVESAREWSDRQDPVAGTEAVDTEPVAATGAVETGPVAATGAVETETVAAGGADQERGVSGGPPPTDHESASDLAANLKSTRSRRSRSVSAPADSADSTATPGEPSKGNQAVNSAR